MLAHTRVKKSAQTQLITQNNDVIKNLNPCVSSHLTANHVQFCQEDCIIYLEIKGKINIAITFYPGY